MGILLALGYVRYRLRWVLFRFYADWIDKKRIDAALEGVEIKVNRFDGRKTKDLPISAYSKRTQKLFFEVMPCDCCRDFEEHAEKHTIGIQVE